MKITDEEKILDLRYNVSEVDDGFFTICQRGRYIIELYRFSSIVETPGLYDPDYSVEFWSVRTFEDKESVDFEVTEITEIPGFICEHHVQTEQVLFDNRKEAYRYVSEKQYELSEI